MTTGSDDPFLLVHAYCDDELDANADTETQPMLHRRAVADSRLSPNALRPRLVDLFAKPRQRVRRPVFAHQVSATIDIGTGGGIAGARRNIVTPPETVNAAPTIQIWVL